MENEIQMRKVTPDDFCSINPFPYVKDTGGSNGQEDVKLTHILKTERFYHTIIDSLIFPERYRRVHVVERLFVDNYNNLFLSWMAQTADGLICNPYHHIGLEETTYDSRRYPDDVVPWETLEVREDAFKRFRFAASNQLHGAQRRAVANFKPIRKVETSYSGEPVNMLDR